MWTSTQIPHIVRFALAATTGVPESKIRVIAPDVGGGFGGKLAVTPEEWITFAVARGIGKPIKYTETRSESLATGHHGRAQVQNITLAAEKDGTVTGLKVHLDADLGSYVALLGGGTPVLGAFMFNAIYKFPAYQFNCQTVFTNRTWTDAYRGAGRPEATFAIERVMDDLAAHLGVDPLEIREKNWIKNTEFPFTTVSGLAVRHRQLRGRHGEGEGGVRVRRAPGRAEGAPRSRRPGPARHRGVDVHRDVRPGTQPDPRPAVLRRRRLGACRDPDARDRQGRGRHRGEPARAGPRDRLQPDRGRPARRTVRGRRGAARRHPGVRPGSRHLRLPLAGARRRGGRHGGRQGDREGQDRRRASARGQRRRRAVRERPLHRRRHRPGHGHRRGRAGDVHGAQLPGRTSSRTSTRRRRSTR